MSSGNLSPVRAKTDEPRFVKNLLSIIQLPIVLRGADRLHRLKVKARKSLVICRQELVSLYQASEIAEDDCAVAGHYYQTCVWETSG